MEFDDIYRILDDPARGSPADWADRFRAAHGQTVPSSTVSRSDERPASSGSARGARVSAWRQFRILSARNLKILFQDKISLGLMLALAPLLGLTYLAYGSNLFDPVNGDPGRIIIASFMGTLTTALVGAMGGLREIVKEIDIYRRERVVNLRIVPYLLSKAWVGVIVALYQAVVLLICTMLFVNPPLPDGPLPLLVTLFLGTLTGYIIGLTISAAAPNQNSAMLLVIAALVPQFLFGGALLPLDTIPGGEVISRFMPTRWLLEAGVRATGLGHELIADACWALPKAEREKLTEAQKADCACLGANLFTRCRTFPGILSPDFFDASAQRTVAQSQPAEPPQPTALPSPTPLPTLKPWPSPTPLPLPTPWPTLTSPPLPADPQLLGSYLFTLQTQGEIYQATAVAQFEAYAEAREAQGRDYASAREAQGQEYADVRQAQGDDYAAQREAQGDEYAGLMRTYGDARAEWQESREKAISSAEGLLATIYDTYQPVFSGTPGERWGALLAIMAGLLALMAGFQKLKDAG